MIKVLEYVLNDITVIGAKLGVYVNARLSCFEICLEILDSFSELDIIVILLSQVRSAFEFYVYEGELISGLSVRINVT